MWPPLGDLQSHTFLRQPDNIDTYKTSGCIFMFSIVNNHADSQPHLSSLQSRSDVTIAGDVSLSEIKSGTSIEDLDDYHWLIWLD